MESLTTEHHPPYIGAFEAQNNLSGQGNRIRNFRHNGKKGGLEIGSN
jgi:hypothetical protein